MWILYQKEWDFQHQKLIKAFSRHFAAVTPLKQIGKCDALFRKLSEFLWNQNRVCIGLQSLHALIFKIIRINWYNVESFPNFFSSEYFLSDILMRVLWRFTTGRSKVIITLAQPGLIKMETSHQLGQLSPHPALATSVHWYQSSRQSCNLGVPSPPGAEERQAGDKLGSVLHPSSQDNIK